jgi:hypothetical protein
VPGSLPTSIADDERLLSADSAGQLSVRHRAAVVARLEHKRLLATAAEVLAAYEARAADGTSLRLTEATPPL